jgi:IS4 transposase
MADCDKLPYAAFHDWFEPGFVALLREILDGTIENLDTERPDLNGRLERVRDVLIADATTVSLYQDAADVYAATGEDQAELKFHLARPSNTVPYNRRNNIRTESATYRRAGS